jgi:predicted nucleic acid-binding protein
MRPSPSPAMMAWLSRKPENRHFFVTAISVAEILFGLELLTRGKRRDKMLAQAQTTFAEDFAGRVLPFDEDAAHPFPGIAARRRAQGRPIADLDAQIAAIVHSRDAILATRNTADFEAAACGWKIRGSNSSKGVATKPATLFGLLGAPSCGVSFLVLLLLLLGRFLPLRRPSIRSLSKT